MRMVRIVGAGVALLVVMGLGYLVSATRGALTAARADRDVYAAQLRAVQQVAASDREQLVACRSNAKVWSDDLAACREAAAVVPDVPAAPRVVPVFERGRQFD